MKATMWSVPLPQPRRDVNQTHISVKLHTSLYLEISGYLRVVKMTNGKASDAKSLPPGMASMWHRKCPLQASLIHRSCPSCWPGLGLACSWCFRFPPPAAWNQLSSWNLPFSGLFHLLDEWVLDGRLLPQSMVVAGQNSP